VANEQAPSSGAPTSEVPLIPAGPGLPPGYVWAYPPSPPSWKAPRWLIILSVVWGVALLVSGIVYAVHGKATVREQTTIVGALPVVDAATHNVIGSAGPAVVAISGFDKIGDCKITPVRSGVSYGRTIDIYATPGTESALLRTVAAGLPASYRAHSGPGNILDLYADAGDYVAVNGSGLAPGEIEVRVVTGCRELGGRLPIVAAPVQGSAEMAPVQEVLTVFGIRAISTSAAEISCGSGRGVLRTVEAHTDQGQPGPLGAALATLAPAPFVSSPNLLAYRSGSADVAVTTDSSGMTITATQRCQ
jgi:hypothetical protein